MAELMRSRLIPGFMNVFGLLLPSDLQSMFLVRS